MGERQDRRPRAHLGSVAWARVEHEGDSWEEGLLLDSRGA